MGLEQRGKIFVTGTPYRGVPLSSQSFTTLPVFFFMAHVFSLKGKFFGYALNLEFKCKFFQEQDQWLIHHSMLFQCLQKSSTVVVHGWHAIILSNEINLMPNKCLNGSRKWAQKKPKNNVSPYEFVDWIECRPRGTWKFLWKSGSHLLCGDAMRLNRRCQERL